MCVCVHYKAIWSRNVLVDTALIFITQTDDFLVHLSIDRVLFYGCILKKKKVICTMTDIGHLKVVKTHNIKDCMCV